jgi:hypothetical protein
MNDDDEDEFDPSNEKSCVPSYMAYEDDRWDDYHKVLERHKNPAASRVDFGAFLPDPDEIRERIGQMQWLKLLGFDNRYLCSIMQHDCPDISLVRKMVEKYGADETRERLDGMLEKTEYDNCSGGDEW